MRLATRVSCAVLSAALLSQLSACGTLFYPERRGQIDGRIDPAIVAFDAIGLLFYIIPLKMKYLAWVYLLLLVVEVVQLNFFPVFALLNYFLFFGG